MDRIRLMVNGLPGNMAAITARAAVEDRRFALLDLAFTGPEIEDASCKIADRTIRLVRPGQREAALAEIQEGGDVICIDFTHPSAVNDNAEFYCRRNLPFVMGTTGGNREALAETVENSSVCAVIAPNMAKQIVAFQAMMEYAAKAFPDVFEGYSLSIRESHQRGKADTSGTAKAMVRSFNHLGLRFSEDDIVKVRDPEVQKDELGVPEDHLGGHGWHTYSLTSPDGTVTFTFTHNVNGREVYARGALDAAVYLAEKVESGASGKVFSMIDVLKGK